MSWWAGELYRKGLRPGQRCALLLSDPVELLTALLACDRLGTTAVILDPTWPTAVREAALVRARPELALSVLPPPPSAVRGPVERQLADSGTPIPSGGQVLFLAAFTSGTTGEPRAVLRTRNSWLRSFRPFSELTGIGPGSTVLVPGPLTSTLFLFGAVHALAVGGTTVLAPQLTRLRWTAAHLVPAMLADLVDAPYDIGGRTVVCAGAAIPAAVADAANRRGLDVVGYYGAAELSFVAAGRGRLDAFPGVEVELRGPRREIWVRSAYLAEGYLSEGSPHRVRGNESRSDDCGHHGEAADSWPYRRDQTGFATVGDLGRYSPEGSLEVLGRGGELVLTGAASVLPEEVEAVLRTARGVREVAVVGTAHPRLGQVVTAVIEVAGEQPLTRAGLRIYAASRLAPAQRPRRWYAVNNLPRTGSGKVARETVVSGLADGSLGAVRLL